MAAIKPVTFISDILTKKQIIKTDIDGNIRFVVSGTNGHGYGHVSSSYPITASGLFIDGDAYISETIHAKRMHVTEVTTSVYYEDALSASINALQDVSASNSKYGDVLSWDGTNWIPSSETGDKLALLAENYAKLSETHIGFFDVDGTKTLELANFSVNDLENIYLDVVIRYSGSEDYVNDLISVRMRGNIATNKINVLLDAPTVSNGDKYRVIATKQTGSLF